MEQKQVVCDTDVIIDYWNRNNSRHSNTRYAIDRLIGINNVILSAVTQMELIIGANDNSDLNRINKNVHQFKIALIDANITGSAVQLLQNYRLSRGLALPDALIAATALTLKMELFSYNLKDYRFIDKMLLYNQVSR